MTVESIKAAITELGSEERASLTAWLTAKDAEEWDRQMEEDFSPGGAGMALLEEAEDDIRAGSVTPMDEFLAAEKAATRRSRS